MIRLLALLVCFSITNAVYFRVWNPDYPNEKLSSLHKWKIIAEPQRTIALKAMQSEKAEYKDTKNLKFVWNIHDDVLTGSEVSYVFSSLGYHRVTLKVYHTDTEDVETYTDNVMVKYIRREIRSLTDDDREKLFSAMKIVYNVPMAEGMKTYGDDFRDITYLMKKHIYGAASRSCDHWHDSTGIVTHHIAFTLEMDKSLQSIEPSVTMPYWSYTYDSLEYGSDWNKLSKIFDSEWFGNADPGGVTHAVSDGFLGLYELPTPSPKIPLITNPYGIMRSPWNVNNAPYLTRSEDEFGDIPYSGEIPGCTAFLDCINTTSISHINNCLNGDTHGPVHILLGGQWDREPGRHEIAATEMITQIQLLMMKSLWRQGYVRCPTSCTADGIDEETGGDCSCYVPDEILALHGAYKILVLSSVMHDIDYTSERVYYDQKLDKFSIHFVEESKINEYWEGLLANIADAGSVGEMFTSASPWDPTFWIIHPESERLLNYKLLTTDGATFDRSWGYEHTPDSTPSDTGKVCDWTGVGDAPDMPACERGLCPGHHQDDLLPFSNFKGLGELYTNWEFFEYMAPDNDEYPYIYDNFEWEHCVEDGVELGETATTSDTTSSS